MLKDTNNTSFDDLVAEQGFVVDILEDLLEAMEERGVSQTELARRLGVSRAAVSRVLNSTNLTTRTIYRYAKAIGVDVRVEFGAKTRKVLPYRAANTNGLRNRMDLYHQARGAA